ncbi:MAG: hypothetical protein JWP01_3276 [Myxococcales bacterium]|nr:hypothetical protein [Myxococcales bacterium]
MLASQSEVLITDDRLEALSTEIETEDDHARAMLNHPVNFFGHAAVASWRIGRGGLPLGAMLPDFSTMCGARIVSAPDPEVADGIALHHATDKAFHTLPVVTGLMRELDQRLERGGCARGPRRAVAHIGVELLIDGVLIDNADYRESYILGLEYDTEIVWRDEGDDLRFAALLARLRAHGVPVDLKKPEAITHRMQRMLGHRPLLAPTSSDLATITVALIEHKPRVQVAVDTVLRALRATLIPKLDAAS